jgi:hypothetical protein
MTIVTVDETQAGQIIASDGVLVSVTLKTIPNQYGNDYLSLTDCYYTKDALNNDVLAQELGLYNLHVCTTPVSAGSILFTAGKYRFANLTLKSIPPGCSIDIDYELPPAPPTPPTLTLLNPATAVAGSEDQTVSCTGTGFTANSIVTFGGVDTQSVFNSDTELLIVVKPTLYNESIVPVQVREEYLSSGTLDFTFTAPVREVEE